MPRVALYTTRFCPYCLRAKMLLDEFDIAYDEIDLGVEPHRREEMIERAGGRCTVPQVFIDGDHVGGCDELQALAARGALDELADGGGGDDADGE